MLKCNPKNSPVPCKSQAEIGKFLDPRRFSFPFANQYMDFGDFTEPIKKYLDDQLFWEIESTRIKRANFFVMLSEAEFQD